MTRGRLVCFILLVVSLVYSIDRQTMAQSVAVPAAAQVAGAPAQNDAAQPAAPPAAFSSAAAKEAAAPAESAAQPRTTSTGQMRISGGDLLNVSVYGVPELQQDVRVNNSGDVYLPLIGYVQLAGLTLDQSQTVVENRLREGEFVKNPHVTMFLKDFVNQSATVTGEVARPGIYPVLGSRRLLELLAAAGGPSARAGKTATITHREHPDDPAKVNLPTDLAKSPEDNIEVLPGDTIVVNRAGLVYVVGEVQRPSGLVMDNNEKMTVMQAIALVGGPTPVAAMNSAKLLRATGTGREELQLPLRKMLSTKQPDVDLRPDDIIFVPASFGKKAAKRSVESVLAVTQSLAIYHP
ncbi:MAG: polysaccharide biosynthesis/export family protein [Terriglobales bacterium]